MKQNDWLLFGVGAAQVIAAVFVGGWMIGIYRGMRNIMQKQTDLMDGQLKAAATAANAAAKSADTSVAIELPIWAIVEISADQQSPDYSITLRNCGRTPAIVTHDCLVAKIAPALDPAPRYPMASVNRLEIEEIINPEKLFVVQRSTGLSEEAWAGIYAGKQILWIFGYIDYVDFLKVERREGFCIGFKPARKTKADRVYTAYPPQSVSGTRGGPVAYTYNRRKQDS